MKGTKFSCVSYKGTNPVHKGSILMTNHLPEAPPLHFILLRGGGQGGVLIYMFERALSITPVKNVHEFLVFGLHVICPLFGDLKNQNLIFRLCEFLHIVEVAK